MGPNGSGEVVAGPDGRHAFRGHQEFGLSYIAYVGESIATPEQLELAVSGLAGLAGALLLPTLGAWLRLLLTWLESDRSGLGRNPRMTGLGVLRALFTTFALGFFTVALLKAAAELREVRVEAPVFASTVTGIAVGIAFWAIYALGVSALKSDWEQARQRGRMRRLS